MTRQLPVGPAWKSFTLLTWGRHDPEERSARAPRSGGQHRSRAHRAYPTCRSLRHADGTLERECQGGGRGGSGRLDAALARSNVRRRAVKGLAMGYARIGGAAGCQLIVDAAPPMLGRTGSYTAHAYDAGVSSWCRGGNRWSLSCGSGRGFGAAWRRAGTRATAKPLPPCR